MTAGAFIDLTASAALGVADGAAIAFVAIVVFDQFGWPFDDLQYVDAYALAAALGIWAALPIGALAVALSASAH